jgi:hypothetical protein
MLSVGGVAELWSSQFFYTVSKLCGAMELYRLWAWGNLSGLPRNTGVGGVVGTWRWRLAPRAAGRRELQRSCARRGGAQGQQPAAKAISKTSSASATKTIACGAGRRGQLYSSPDRKPTSAPPRGASSQGPS